MSLTTDERWLAAHNYLRCRHGHDNLSWSYAVKTNAQNHANTCTFDHSDSYENTPPSGENLAMGYYSPERATEAWYNEISDYQQNGQHTGVVGHYTALIWKTTGDLGCGTCDGQKIDVCQYANAASNFGGQVANDANVPSTNTPTATEP
eukprot:UN29936